MAKKKLLPVSTKNLCKNVPFYVLYGLRHNPTATYYLRNPEDSFLLSKNEKSWNELWNVVESIATPQVSAENIMGMLHAGWNHFNGTDVHATFFKNGNKKFQMLYAKHPLDIMRALKSLLNGADHYNWYQDTLDTFVELLPDHDIELFVKTFAVTSPMSHLHTNLIDALRAYDCLKSGRSVKDLRCINSVKSMLIDLENGIFEREVSQSRRKITNFANSIFGDERAVVVDSRAQDAFGLARKYTWRKKAITHLPRVGEYDIIEYYIRALAEASGYEARQIVAMIWAGIRILEGKFKKANTRKILLELTSKSPN